MSRTEPEGEFETMVGEAVDPKTREQGRGRPRPLARGDVVGRYVVLERLGVGGMGEVYAAYDPELDRKIAIKLLLAEHGAAPNFRLGQPATRSFSSAGPGRLLREAQAMAKLQHANVVAVHDVGTHEQRVFVAMEYVDGGTLADWITAGCDGLGKPHPWPEVLARFLAAGEGLVAAHAAGLIHRDFKPANVLVGSDGSIRVADFGLARATVLEPEPAGEPRAEPSSVKAAIDDAPLPALDRSLGGKSIKSLSMRMTLTGATLGTPAYMAPEQYSHTQIDARADQFSFCVALWEALHGERPFAGDNLHALMFAIAQANVREPPIGSEVPTAIRKALIRGLSHDPQRRWPDMQALLAELRVDSHGRRRRLQITLGGVALLGVLVGGALLGRPEPSIDEPICAGAAAALGDALTPERREAIARRFADFDQQWAHDLGERLLPRLDAWTDEWRAAWTDACEDTHVRAEQSGELLDRRLSCLDRQRRGFVKLVDGLANADEALARNADGLLAEIGSIAACSDSDALLRITPMPADPELAKAIEAADEIISDAHGLYVAGQIQDAKALLDSQRELVGALDYAPLAASFEELSGRLAIFLDDPAGGERALERAFALALEAGDDRRAAKIARSLAHELRELDRTGDASRWLMIGAALAERLDSDSLRGQFALTRSQVLASAGDYPGAETAAEAALELFRRLQKDGGIGDALYLMGVAASRDGRYDQAIERVEQARVAWSAEVGPRHPRNVSGIGLLGVAHRFKGDYAAAEVYFREAMEIQQETYGADDVHATSNMINLAVVLSDQGKHDEGIALIERVIEIRRASATASPSWTGRTLVNLAQMQRKAGRLEQAAANIEEGEALLRSVVGDDHPDLIVAFHIRAMIEFERGQLEQAELSIRASLRIASKEHGPDHPSIFELRTDGARIALARGKLKLAAEWIEGSLPTDTSANLIGDHEFVSAKIHAAYGREQEARAAALRAKQAYEKDGPGSAKALADVEAWLLER